MESARPAVVDDLETISALWATAAAELREERGGRLVLTREAAALNPTKRFGETTSLVAAGLYDEVIVGFAVAHIEKLSDNSTLGVIEALYVEPGARAVGVGEALMSIIVDWAQRQGCSGVDALVLPGMRDSKNFFEAHGLTARAIVVHRDL